MQREKWVDEVLNSTEGMHRAMPPDDLYEQFVSRLRKPAAAAYTFPLKQWVAAAVLLLALNIGSVVYLMGRNRQNNQSVNPIATALELDSTYNY